MSISNRPFGEACTGSRSRWTNRRALMTVKYGKHSDMDGKKSGKTHFSGAGHRALNR